MSDDRSSSATPSDAPTTTAATSSPPEESQQELVDQSPPVESTEPTEPSSTGQPAAPTTEAAPQSTESAPREESSAPQPPPFVPLLTDRTPKDYGTAKAYAEAVRTWYSSSQKWLQTQHSAFLQNNPIYGHTPSLQTFTFNSDDNSANAPNNLVVNVRHRRVIVDRNVLGNGVAPAELVGANNVAGMAAAGVAAPAAFSFRRLLGLPPAQQAFTFQTNTLLVQRWTIPNFSLRICAELLDFVLLFVVKMAIVYSLVELEAIDLDQFDQILSNSADLQTLIDLTQGLFHVEVLAKIASGVLEALCLAYGFASYPGSTPGKHLMGLRVISCVDVQPVVGALNQVTVTSLPYISLKSALVRSLLKNLVTNFLFPVNAFFYTFQYNRSIYDLAAKTIVVTRHE